MRRPRAGSRRYFSINFFSPCPVSLSPNVRVFWGTRAAPDIDRVLVYTQEGSNRADTEAKWSRINQRRPIINELRLRPPRVCIKTRLFVTHLSRVRPVPRTVFVITLRRQTVSIRRRGLYTKARVGPAVSSRERATRGFFLRVPLPPSSLPGLRSFRLLHFYVHAVTSIGSIYSVSFSSLMPYTDLVSFETTPKRERFRDGKGEPGEGITTSRIIISRRKRTPTRHCDFFVSLSVCLSFTFSPFLSPFHFFP